MRIHAVWTGTNDREFGNGGLGLTGMYLWYLSRDFELSLRQGVKWSQRDNANDSVNGLTRGALDCHFNVTTFLPLKPEPRRPVD